MRADLPGRGTTHWGRRGDRGAAVRELGRPAAHPGRGGGDAAGFCAEVGIPATAAGFRADLHERLDAQCRATDGAYPGLVDFTIDDAGRPWLKQFRAAPPTPSAQALGLVLAVRVGLATAGGRLA
ncbi:hypothetical protein ACWCQS_40230 [Streptomyces sp. NPDC002076]